MDKILEVKNLKISFRTSNGTVKAVRDISFDLERGKTLAIVGESGSGKSVTSRAILGILAGNAIIEGGEILYDGKDLLKIDEELMHKMRGDKIAMIFQDPLSSLNPIVKIGKQITEAMLLKNKSNRRESRNEFNRMLAILKQHMIAADTTGSAKRIEELTVIFDKCNIVANQYENAYNNQYTKAIDLISEINDVLFKYEKKQKTDFTAALGSCGTKLKKIHDRFLTNNYDQKLTDLALSCNKLKKASKDKDFEKRSTELLAVIRDTLTEMTSATKPGFFRIGHYLLKKPNAKIDEMPLDALNKEALEFLYSDFMDEFTAYERLGVAHSYNVALEKKKALLPELKKAREFYSGEFTKKDAIKYANKLSALVEDSIDRLEIIKDNVAYTFRTGLITAIERYFECKKRNPKEESRYARQTAKRDKLIAAGKTVDWKVIPKSVYDLDDVKDDIVSVVNRLLTNYEKYISESDKVDFNARSQALVEYFRDKASQVVYRLTKRMAKEMAVKLMEEVGIHEPRRRFYQYPFEFSGGMRQRIVIAIALVANPDILICDEPTTALDVTIQAQILELINKLKRERNLSVIFITHDLGVVANMADDIAVMYAGKIVEYGTSEDIFYNPRHPYTWALLSSMPELATTDKLDTIPGTPPNMIFPPEGDAFAERNKYAMEIDFELQPPMFKISDTHYAATWLLHPNAPKVDIPKNITDRIERMKEQAKKAGGNNE